MLKILKPVHDVKDGLIIQKRQKMKETLARFGLMYIFVVIVSLVSLKLANDIGGYWINVAWVIGVWFGIETILFLDWIKEYKKAKAL